MYRKELGVHFKPYYDEGDYQVEINVFDRGYIGDSRVAHDFMGITYVPEQQAILNMARIGEYTRDNMTEVEFNLKVTEDAREIEDQRIWAEANEDVNRRYLEQNCESTADCEVEVHKKKYHTPRLYYTDDMPYINGSFDWVKGEVVCMDMAFLIPYKRFVRSRSK